MTSFPRAHASKITVTCDLLETVEKVKVFDVFLLLPGSKCVKNSQQPRGGTSCAESADRNGDAEKGVEEYYNFEVKLLL